MRTFSPKKWQNVLYIAVGLTLLSIKAGSISFDCFNPFTSPPPPRSPLPPPPVLPQAPEAEGAEPTAPSSGCGQCSGGVECHKGTDRERLGENTLNIQLGAIVVTSMRFQSHFTVVCRVSTRGYLQLSR